MTTHIDVRFHEVDAYNVVHNVHYFNYFDIGRFHLVNAFLRREKPSEIGEYLFLVLKSDCKFVHPARLADLLAVETEFLYNPAQVGTNIVFQHRVVKIQEKRIAAEGASTLGICDREFHLQYRLPGDIRAYLHEQLRHHLREPRPNVKVWAGSGELG
ncbi:MAG: thioesterase family protein [Phycisphaerae bacterium]|nr:thioesterase family protein [Phycisphaerae bacterium]